MGGDEQEGEEKAKARREAYHHRRAADPNVGIHGVAILAGPEVVPEEFFTEDHRKYVLEGV